MKEHEFKEWVKNMYHRYNEDRNTLGAYNYKVTIVYNVETKKLGIAKCHPNEYFDAQKGLAIAYARCKGIEVPKISTYKKFCELKNGDRFKGYLSTYLFIGKCYGHNNEITYAIQNIETLNIKQVSTDYYNKKVEMVE